MAAPGGQQVTRKSMEPDVLQYIEANPQCAASDIRTALNLNTRSLQNALVRMIERGDIHVAEYGRVVPGSGRIARLFVAGPGQQARKPARPSKAATNSRKAKWLREKRQMAAVLNRASSMGVFGVVMAQIDRNPKTMRNAQHANS